jgi:hypothetical protein
MAILGDIPVRKWITPDGSMHVGSQPAGSTPLLATDGRPDTSFAAYVPGNQCWTFQLLDSTGKAIPFGTAQTWHQAIPGEQRTNCQGCHNHWQPDQVQFEDTAAARPDYEKLWLRTAERIEYRKHIQPIEQRTGIVIGPKPYQQASGPKAFHSSQWALLSNPDLTAAEVLTLAKWCDTGFMAGTTLNDGTPIVESMGAGPWKDTMPPTLSGASLSDRLVFGSLDPDSGVDWLTLEIRDSSGAILPHTVSGDMATVAGEPAGRYVATIRDKQGNQARLVIDAEGELPDPPDEPDPELERLRAENADLKSRLKDIKERATLPE